MLELAVLLFFIGLLLVTIEIFVPSFGLLTLLAGMSFVASIVLAFRTDEAWGYGILAATIVLVPALAIAAFKVLPVTPIGKRLILAGPDRTDAAPGADVSSEPLHALVGREGLASSKLRPAGVVVVDGRRVDVVTEGEWIDAGTPVVVTEVNGNRAVVRAREDAPAEEST